MEQVIDDFIGTLANCPVKIPAVASTGLKYAPPTVFTKFVELPIELRLRIWRYLIPESRIIDVEVYEHYLTSGSLGWRKTQRQIVVRNHWNSICMVNHESRNEFLQRYTVKPNNQQSLPQFPIDPISDVFYLGDACFSKKGPHGLLTQKTKSLHNAMSVDLRNKIQHIAVPFKTCQEIDFPWLFKRLPALKKFTFVFGRSESWPGLKNAYLIFCPDSEGIPLHSVTQLRIIEDQVQSYWRTDEGKKLYKERGFRPLLSVKWLTFSNE